MEVLGEELYADAVDGGAPEPEAHEILWQR
jgi:hypothetical protein